MKMVIPSLWTQGLSEKEAESFKKILLNSTLFSDRLTKIIDQQILNLEGEEVSSEHFNKPDWAVRQAFILGQKKQLRGLRSLFAFRQKD